jgi:DNA-binding MarR family transcriptional regulator
VSSVRRARRLERDQMRWRRTYRRVQETLESPTPLDRAKSVFADLVEIYCADIPSMYRRVSASNLLALFVLWRYEELAFSELALILHRDLANVRRSVERLEDLAYVRIREVERAGTLDYRLVSITPAGDALLDRLVAERIIARSQALKLPRDSRSVLSLTHEQRRNRAHGNETAH